MKKLVVKLFSLMLCLALSFTLFACDNNNTNVTDGDEDVMPVREKVYVNENEIEEVSESENYFIKNGVSDYTIQVPANYTPSEYKAATELRYFINDAVGVLIPIVRDDELHTEDEAYICIGKTSTYYANDVSEDGTVTSAKLGNDGFRIKTYNKLVILASYGQNGIIYSAYGFLERVMDYEFYFEDEWVITHEKDVKLKDMNVCDIPTFDSRCLDTRTNAGRAEYGMRIRQHGSQSGNGVGDGPGWVLGDQSLCAELLTGDLYQDEFPSWFNGYIGRTLSAYSGQLCLGKVLKNEPIASKSNPNVIKAPMDELFMRLKGYIVANPSSRIFMLGINDNSTDKCQCSVCKPEVMEINYSGQMILLASRLLTMIRDWQEDPTSDCSEFDRGRDIKLAFFAYLYTLEAPTHVNENGDIVPNTYIPHDYEPNVPGLSTTPVEIHADDHASVRIAPIASVNMFTHDDMSMNPAAAIAFRSWPKVASCFSIWDYGTDFSEYMAPYPDFGTMKDNFELYVSIGVSDILTQLAAHTTGAAFYGLQIYVRSKLMWDINYEIDELIENYFYNYYGPEASVYMFEYFNWLRSYYQTMSFNGGFDSDYNGRNPAIYTGKIYETLAGSTFFPFASTKLMKSYFDKAYDAVKAAKDTTDPVDYDKYIKRLDIESLWYQYVQLLNYTDYFTNDDLGALVDNFERCAKIADFHEFNNNKDNYDDMSVFISALRSQLQ